MHNINLIEQTTNPDRTSLVNSNQFKSIPSKDPSMLILVYHNPFLLVLVFLILLELAGFQLVDMAKFSIFDFHI